MPKPESSPNLITTPFPFTVTIEDGSIERITIKKPSITKLYEWLYLSKDNSEPAMVALCTGKDLVWVNSLELDSFAQLAAKSSEIYFTLALRLSKGAPVAAALIAPLIQRNLLGLKVTEILSGGSGGSLIPPPPSASVAATDKGSPTPTASTNSDPQSERAAA